MPHLGWIGISSPGARDGNTRLAAPDDREPTVRKLIEAAGGRLGARRRNPSLTMGVLGCRSRSSQFRSQLCSQLDSFSDMAFARLFPIADVNAHDGDLTFFEAAPPQNRDPWEPPLFLTTHRCRSGASTESADQAGNKKSPRSKEAAKGFRTGTRSKPRKFKRSSATSNFWTKKALGSPPRA